MKICDYGCGKEAKHFFPTVNKWCCESNWKRCPEKRPVGNKNSRFGTTMTESTKKKISKKNKGKTAWNKGKTNIYSKETIEKFKKRSGINHWRYGKFYTIKDYKKYHPLLSKIEEMRYNPDKLDEKEIQVHCKNHNCSNSKEKGGWFTPSKSQIENRYAFIEKGYDGSYFYCCDDCKQDCPLFYLRSDPNKQTNKEQIYTSQEYDTWRNEVLNRADYLCEYCDKKATHVHHSRPQKLEPGFALDPDYGVSCCSKCHYKYGHKTNTECSTSNLANKECI
jgi:hypothetical protein